MLRQQPRGQTNIYASPNVALTPLIPASLLGGDRGRRPLLQVHRSFLVFVGARAESDNLRPLAGKVALDLVWAWSED